MKAVRQCQCAGGLIVSVFWEAQIIHCGLISVKKLVIGLIGGDPGNMDLWLGQHWYYTWNNHNLCLLDVDFATTIKPLWQVVGVKASCNLQWIKIVEQEHNKE